MDITFILSFVIAFIISFFCVPFVGKITKRMGIIAHVNERTVHKGIIPRTGGYGIYMSFLICAMIFLKTDNQINAILIGSFIIFMTGFYDDIHDLPPKVKLAGQVLAALVVIFYGGISLKDFTIPYIPTEISTVIAIIITIGWIVGITNAINLIDGLDGLCAGISMIVLFTISMTSLAYNRSDIASLSMIMAGSIGGFLFFNFHPASIFMGDCGALLIGYMIAVISLLGFGFKSSTFFTLGAPIVVLMVPILDTVIAIIRRKVAGKRIDEADKGHLHHKLMFSFRLGQKKTVLILYIATALFSLCSYLYISHKLAATLLFIFLLIIFEIFIEVTDMISRQYKPILTIANIFIQSEDLPKIKESKAYRKWGRKISKELVIVVLIILCIVGGISGYQYIRIHRKPEISTNYHKAEDETPLLMSIYQKIEENKNDVYNDVAAYFCVDYYTLSNKSKDMIGGIDYMYKARKTAFKNYALENYYKNLNAYISNQSNKEILVSSYSITDSKESEFRLSDAESNKYYDVSLHLTFEKENFILNKKEIDISVTLIEENNQYEVVAFDFV